jgi:hypothetical protein
MRPIPKQLRDEMEADPYYKQCVRRKEGNCSGRITWEHSFEYGGKQINEKWAIIPLCWYHHLGDGLDKDYNQYISVNRMTKADEDKYPRKNWKQLRSYLNGKYENKRTRHTETNH